METVSDVMTRKLDILDAGAPLLEAARLMRDDDIGDVIITQDERLYGILTDRDIVVRCLAEQDDPSACICGDHCTTGVVTLNADAPIDHAIRLMREHALRRIVVVEQDKPVGIVSLGDLAQRRDRRSALGDISAAAPNR